MTYNTREVLDSTLQGWLYWKKPPGVTQFTVYLYGGGGSGGYFDESDPTAERYGGGGGGHVV